jgi:AcrR family transcriptional regulator
VSRTEQKQQTRQRIVDAAGRGFRLRGYDGLGVDQMAREAGVTSGAFYGHFGGKAEAFREAIGTGMADLKAGVLHFQAAQGSRWWPEFVRFYLGVKRTCDLSQGCTLQCLSPELARADETSRALFESGLRDVAQAVVDGPVSKRAPRTLDAACAALASLAGAVTLARAVGSEQMGLQIATAMEQALLGPGKS